MSKVHLAVVYYSSYGTNHRLAEIAVKAAEEAGAEVRLRKAAETAPQAVIDKVQAWKEFQQKTADVAEAKPEDLQWANAFLFSAPTRFGTVASQMRAFIDTLGPIWQKGDLAGKAVSVMTSAQNLHGGQESTLLGMYTTFAHWGSVIVPPGFTDPAMFKGLGNPYGASSTMGEIKDEVQDIVRYQVRRLLQVAGKLIA
ncbi:NAD(P)H:quinone oxidoreductase [Comamonas sp. NLF-1-9]|uniref:NAD(P)H:quinone oxidoreductase n=1 Tax=Comamonas sp. NLF-1-9 TaxID=2853163 RepID=UPI001C47E219|nr:NAD(P)H:quinone oxidoreductase [Comamonas sp. NLF-1-9]QXL85424.1 NAD(P)H:quinone oxidoreductase [Comamonas sp. NLF-1-9]